MMTVMFEPEVIRVNFSRPMPLFPLPETVLLPHAVQPLHIFESRYLEMVNDCLDGSGQIAMACFGHPLVEASAFDCPPIRSACCVGQIIHHQALPDGRHNIVLHGVCRAKIRKIREPDEEHSYRRALLSPLESVEEDPPPLLQVRRTLRSMLESEPLRRMRGVTNVLELFDNEEITTHALLELIGFSMISPFDLKYQLLEEGQAELRARLIVNELRSVARIVRRADRQGHHDWPKGMSWN